MHLQPNTTLDGWQNGGTDRSSWNILWSCLATIISCTWTVLHLNVPRRGSTENENILRKLRWLVLTALAPELITSYAFGEYLQARRLLSELKEVGVAEQEWNLSHAFYLSMGSLNLRTADGYEFPLCKREKTEGGWEVPSCNSDIVVLRASKVLPTSYPIITKEEIQDRSKADPFTKAFTLIQSTWFVVNAVARSITGLPICPLEISCIAYVFCTCVTYGFWWKKPKDILTTLVVPCHFNITGLPTDIQQSIRSFDPVNRVQCHQAWSRLDLPDTEKDVINVIRGRMPALMGLIIGVTFCSIHIAAWNFEFPSRAEAILWRLSSVGAAGIPILSLSIVFIRGLSPATFDSLWAYVLTLYCMFIILYASARLAVIALLFSTLRNLPVGSFVTINWARQVPHM
ncbi:uncharacterized protein K441DRAFT_653313 [Cenococcum geophilum 1.58]|uniref:uncharacterized protein n=1 Tax=Cenococcum geophilum 1.58 TaxID=794803 RepID=UPI00358EAE8B|nr:hypothetical protein K441DRAFT_653313 [Cenococcum geophilum 1.58]